MLDSIHHQWQGDRLLTLSGGGVVSMPSSWAVDQMYEMLVAIEQDLHVTSMIKCYLKINSLQDGYSDCNG